MKKLLILLILLAGCQPREMNPETMKEELIKTDVDFCEMALEKGVREAFTFYADEDVVMMRDGALPLFGRKELIKNYEKNPRTGVQLRWVPVKAEVSGDLGYTFGKWEMKVQGRDTTWYGTYVTIWKKQKNGTWRFVLDGGNSSPKP